MKFRYNNKGGAATAVQRKGQISHHLARKNQDFRWKRRWQGDVIFLLNLGIDESMILKTCRTPPNHCKIAQTSTGHGV